MTKRFRYLLLAFAIAITMWTAFLAGGYWMYSVYF